MNLYKLIVSINGSEESKGIGTMAAIAVGVVILLKVRFAGPIAKASMHSVRALTPALFTDNV